MIALKYTSTSIVCGTCTRLSKNICTDTEEVLVAFGNMGYKKTERCIERNMNICRIYDGDCVILDIDGGSPLIMKLSPDQKTVNLSAYLSPYGYYHTAELLDNLTLQEAESVFMQMSPDKQIQFLCYLYCDCEQRFGEVFKTKSQTKFTKFKQICNKNSIRHGGQKTIYTKDIGIEAIREYKGFSSL